MDLSGRGDESAADMTKRGEKYIEGRCQERFQHPESESKVCIDHQHPHIRQARLAVQDRRDPAEAVG